MKKFSTRELLNKLKWHPDYSFEKVSVIYIDRPKGFTEVSGDEIEDIGHKFIYLVSGTAIPMHRIVEIRYDGKTLWRKVDGKEPGEKSSGKRDG